MAGALKLAGEIAGRSPVAVQGTKVNLIYSRDHSVAEGLDYMVTPPHPPRPAQDPELNCVSGLLEHEHAADGRCDEIRPSCPGEEESQNGGFLQAVRSRGSTTPWSRIFIKDNFLGSIQASELADLNKSLKLC